MMKRTALFCLFILLCPAIGFGAFFDNGDGTVTDTVTGLMWQQATDGKLNWESAISHCEALWQDMTTGACRTGGNCALS